jgi:hypothetical protein
LQSTARRSNPSNLKIKENQGNKKREEKTSSLKIRFNPKPSPPHMAKEEYDKESNEITLSHSPPSKP